MANKHRGEVDITIAGRTYTLAMTLDAMGRIAEQLGVETIDEIERRIIQLKIADAAPLLRALLDAAGHDVPDKDLKRVGHRTYIACMQALWNAKPGDADGEAPGTSDPQKRAA